MANADELMALAQEARQCRRCESELPLGANPIIAVHPEARILVASQAPGRLAHESGVPFDDPSGRRLREWMGIDADTFYRPQNVAIVPMGFCYPGTLAGGLYGVAMGRVFFGESMFSAVTNASKVALAHVCSLGFELIDCQIPNAHLTRLGAQMIDRKDFAALLNQLGEAPAVLPAARTWSFRCLRY